MKKLTQNQAAEIVRNELGIHGYYHSVSYETSISIRNDKGENPVWHTFELFGRPLVWIDPVILTWEDNSHADSKICARLVIPCKSVEDFDGLLVMNRFATLLGYVINGAKLSPVSWAGSGFPAALSVHDLQSPPYTVVHHDAIDMLIRKFEPSKITDKKWVGIANYRQGIIAKSPYYSFLSLWKVIELYFDDNAGKMSKYLDSQIKTMGVENKMHEGKGSASAKLFATRNRCAHFALSQKGSLLIQDPDDPESYEIAEKDSRVLKRVVENMIYELEWD